MANSSFTNLKVENLLLELSEAHEDTFPINNVKQGIFAVQWIRKNKFEEHPALPKISEIKQWIRNL